MRRRGSRTVICIRSDSYRIVVALLVALACRINGQVFFSVRPDYLKLKHEGSNLLTGYRNAYPDTSLADFHNYFPRNFMGNVGLPSPSYFLDYGTSDLGFRFYGVPSNNDRFNEHQVPYYRSLGPFASLTGVAGSRELQVFKALFSHTYKNSINITLGFRRYTSKGFYRRQQTYTNNFFLSSNYTTPGKKFGFYLFVLNNSNKNNESGGISDSTLTDSTMLLRKELLSERIADANRDNRETKFMFNPWFRLTHGPDSGHSVITHLLVKSRYTGSRFKYMDGSFPTDDFYRFVYLDTAFTYDSSRVQQLSNDLALAFRQRDRLHGLQLGYRNELNRVWQKQDSVFMNHLAMAEIYSGGDPADSLRFMHDFRASAQYVLVGPNTGNYRFEANAQLNSTSTGSGLFIDALYESRSPDYIYNYWVSNHFFWLNKKFRPQRNFQLQAGWRLKKGISASVLFQDIRNYLYFGYDAFPAQVDADAGGTTNLALKIDLAHVFFRHLGVAVQYALQSTSRPSVVRLPPHFLRARVYYQGHLFRNHLQLQIGGEAEVYESFVPYVYMPATQAFYLQDNFSTARYPYLDAFFNARIRPVSIFLKIENLLHGFQGSNYSFVPGYYQPDRAFRMGLSWMFFD